jgi:hypothetical protein
VLENSFAEPTQEELIPINISMLTKGVYYIKVISVNKELTLKWVKE